MMKGLKPPSRAELPRIEDRISFLYVDHCRIEKDDGAIVIYNSEGKVNVPAGQLLVLMLGPGTSVTHKMIQTVSEAGMSVVWCGEEGVRFYAGGAPLSGDTSLLLKQAAIVSNPRLRLAAAKRMYAIRYPEEDFSACTTRQLLGKEGRRVTNRYRELAEQYGIEWKGRRYSPDNYKDNDPLQNAISNANACLYGICYSVIFVFVLSPGLGIIHTGMSKSFVLDIADVYKEAISIPVAFKTVSIGTSNLEHRVRTEMRDIIREKRLAKTIVKDIAKILTDSEIEIEEGNHLWAGRQNIVSGGSLYGVNSDKSD